MHPVLRLVKDNGVRRFKDLVCDFQFRKTGCTENFFTHFGLPVMEGGQAVHKLYIRVACGPDNVHRHLVGQKQPDTFVPNLFWFSHRDPDVCVNEIHP